MSRWPLVATVYVVLGAGASAAAWRAHPGAPLVHPAPWAALAEPDRTVASVLLGGAVAALFAVADRVAVARWPRARRLHEDLRPVARDLGAAGIAALALSSSFAEEAFFRGLLQPAIGLVAQAALFGLAHQVRGPARWLWASWAAVAGLAFGTIHALTGSLAGALVAHAAVNAHGLAFLRDHDPRPRPRRLGGLLHHP